MEPLNGKSLEELYAELDAMRWQLNEANDTIEAIRTGQVDALVVSGDDGPQLYSLKTADHTYRVFVEQMSEGAVTLDEHGVILYCNSSFIRILGLKPVDVTGTLFERLIAEEHQHEFATLFRQGWTEAAACELLLSGVGGNVPCRLSVSALSVEGIDSLSVIVSDLTLQKEAEAILKASNDRLAAANAALERSNYDLLQFASVASHDLQEPLRKIMVFSGMLAQKLPTPEEAGATLILEKIAGSSQRMKRLIGDILAYSQLSNTHGEPEPVPLGEVLTEILDDYEILIREKGASIERGELPTVPANRGQMRQVFQNLVSNALKFSKPGVPPEIHITSAPAADGSACLVTIADNGIGFDLQYKDRIFALFQRLNTKDQFDGSGIGLAITKKIIEEHGGRISVQSEEGIGTTFSIWLPQWTAE